MNYDGTLTSRGRWERWGELLLQASVRDMGSGEERWAFRERASSHGILIDEVEAVSRSFLLASILDAGGRRGDEISSLLELIVHRVSVDSPLAWPSPTHGSSNLVLEAASISIGLWISRARTWDRLAERERSAVSAWLRRAVRGDVSANNWVFFPAATALFLDHVGEGTGDGSVLFHDALKRVDSWRVAGGWCSDGAGATFDYYNSWALNYYPALLAWLSDQDDHLDRARITLRGFIESFVSLFDRDGGMVYFGRSLGYRFAASASLSVAALVGAWDNPAQLRDIGTRNLEYFDRGGALDVNDPLPLGWFRRQPEIAQSYSGPRANFWAAKPFVNLLIDPNNAYWTDRASSLPDDSLTILGGTGLLVSRTDGGATVRLLNQASWNVQSKRHSAPIDDPLYSRSSYSNVTSPADGRLARDSGLFAITPLGPSSRVELTVTERGSHWVSSTFLIRVPNPLHVGGRIGWHAAKKLPLGRYLDLPHPARVFTAVRDGWAVELFEVPRLPVFARGWVFGGHALLDDGFSVGSTLASVEGGGLHAAVVALYGFGSASTEVSNTASPFGESRRFPYLRSAGRRPRLLAAASWLGRQVPTKHPELAIEDGSGTITWPDGAKTAVNWPQRNPESAGW